MLNSISLKCSNCGANLEITPDMETFACGYCGASQMVTRSGGTVSLRLLTESISRVQAGTDKTAAELAIRRLKEEHEINEQAFKQSIANQSADVVVLQKPFFAGAIAVSVLCIAIGTVGGAATIIASLFWFGSICAIFYFFIKQTNESKDFHENQRKKIREKGAAIARRIQENKQIVDS